MKKERARGKERDGRENGGFRGGVGTESKRETNRKR